MINSVIIGDLLILYRSSLERLCNSAIVLLNKAVHVCTYKRDFSKHSLMQKLALKKVFNVILCKQLSKASQICVININLYLHFISLRMPHVINTQNSLNMPKCFKGLNINLLVQTAQCYEDLLFCFCNVNTAVGRRSRDIRLLCAK